MNQGIFIALSGAILKESQVELTAQNLSNSSSMAYKKTNISFKDYLSNAESVQNGTAMTEVARLTVDFTNGEITPTGNPFDIALEGSGFIALDNKQYTRRGDLRKDMEGYLTTKGGIRVLGQNGPIEVPPGKMEIGLKGEVVVDNKPVDTIKLVDFADKKSLTPPSNYIYKTDQAENPAKVVVRQNCMESSNIDIFQEMVKIVSSMREFQALQKAIQSFDELTLKMTEVARI